MSAPDRAAKGWDEVEAERRDIADFLEGLTPEQWDAESLCEGWKVRHVVAHLSQSIYTPVAFIVGLPASGFNVNRFFAKLAVRQGERDVEALVERFRRDIGLRRHAPGTGAVTVLTDAVCHHQDMRRPLGLQRSIPADRLLAVADYAKDIGFPLGAKKRIAGLRLAATDLDWSTGDGPEVTGPLEALVMAMMGRAAAVDDLSGDGVTTLCTRF